MFNPSSSSVPTYSDLSMHHAVSFSTASLPTAPTEIPRRSSGFFHDNGALISPSNVAASAPPPYPSSLPSYHVHSTQPFPFHLQYPDALNGNATFSCPSPSACQVPPPPASSSPSSSYGGFFEFCPGSMRRVFSAGDLQGKNVSPPPPPPPPQFSGDNCSQEVVEPFLEKVGRYSTEERKERIERYRTKRQQRNFQKKITYACRKTLADSRPRVQGRFARNVETEGEAVADFEREVGSDISYEYCSYNDISSNSYDSQNQHREPGSSMTFDDNKWWWGVPVAANEQQQQQQQQQQLGFNLDDEDQLWASLADMCSGT